MIDYTVSDIKDLRKKSGWRVSHMVSGLCENC